MPSRLISRAVLIGALGLLALAPPAAVAAPSAIRAGDAARLTEARAALETARATLARSETPPDALAAARAAAERALSTIEDLVDRYHHAPNLRDPAIRAHALDLRPVVGRLFAADGPLVLHRDVIHPRPELARALADAARRLGDRAGEVAWLRAALATAPDDRALLTALRDAALATGDVPAANAVGARLRALEGAPPPGTPTIKAPR